MLKKLLCFAILLTIALSVPEVDFATSKAKTLTVKEIYGVYWNGESAYEITKDSLNNYAQESAKLELVQWRHRDIIEIKFSKDKKEIFIRANHDLFSVTRDKNGKLVLSDSLSSKRTYNFTMYFKDIKALNSFLAKDKKYVERVKKEQAELKALKDKYDDTEKYLKNNGIKGTYIARNENMQVVISDKIIEITLLDDEKTVKYNIVSSKVVNDHGYRIGVAYEVEQYGRNYFFELLISNETFDKKILSPGPYNGDFQYLDIEEWTIATILERLE